MPRQQPALFPELTPSLPVDAAAEHGEVFTREWVVELILDLVGYTADRELAGLVAIEPACGTGAGPAGGPQRIAMIEDLTNRFGPLEDPRTGTRVGIGVATGADEVFITKTPPDIEDDRLLPLAMARDLSTGKLAWSGNYLVNPWLADGRLVDLRHYPLLRKYLESNKGKLAKRHVAEKSPANWYRTIDKVDGKLTAHQKLLIPDMRMNIHPVLDDGVAYPHHNLYTFTRWRICLARSLLRTASRRSRSSRGAWSFPASTGRLRIGT